jgi:hypothetical protein
VKRLVGFFRLTRPANIVTAISDIFAGAAIAGYASGISDLHSLLLLVIATSGLYGGGVVLNDVFDADLDRIERPERPIPSGLISKKEGALLGIALLAIGVVSALRLSIYPSGYIALAITVAVLLYDKWSKHHSFLGPLNMGLCRGLNLLLGISMAPEALSQYGYLAVVPVIYIAAITMISQGEVRGGKSKTMLMAAFLYLAVFASILYTSILHENSIYTIFFLAFFALIIYPPLIRAFSDPVGKNIGKAVKAGVLALIVMNAGWAAAFGSLYAALFIVLLLPISILLARFFAVT